MVEGAKKFSKNAVYYGSSTGWRQPVHAYSQEVAAAGHGREVQSDLVAIRYRVVAIKQADGYLWFWIGGHEGYDELISP